MYVKEGEKKVVTMKKKENYKKKRKRKKKEKERGKEKKKLVMREAVKEVVKEVVGDYMLINSELRMFQIKIFLSQPSVI